MGLENMGLTEMLEFIIILLFVYSGVYLIDKFVKEIRRKWLQIVITIVVAIILFYFFFR